jgi:hypothetical protein
MGIMIFIIWGLGAATVGVALTCLLNGDVAGAVAWAVIAVAGFQAILALLKIAEMQAK